MRTSDTDPLSGAIWKRTMRDRIDNYIYEQYGVEAEFPWDRDDTSAVYRHKDNKKWFALIMNVRRDKLGLSGDDVVSAINLKIDDINMHEMLVTEDGICPAYHMNKRSWITVVLDGTVPEEQVLSLLDMSFSSTSKKYRRRAVREPKEWIIPANPKFYDVEGAFEKEDIITWKQGAGILAGDTVYMYVAAPVSAILYKCRVLETDIPYEYSDKNLKITALMKIELLKRYERDEFTFAYLGEEYGIYAIRGPRGIPHSLSTALNK